MAPGAAAAWRRPGPGVSCRRTAAGGRSSAAGGAVGGGSAIFCGAAAAAGSGGSALFRAFGGAGSGSGGSALFCAAAVGCAAGCAAGNVGGSAIFSGDRFGVREVNHATAQHRIGAPPGMARGNGALLPENPVCPNHVAAAAYSGRGPGAEFRGTTGADVCVEPGASVGGYSFAAGPASGPAAAVFAGGFGGVPTAAVAHFVSPGAVASVGLAPLPGQWMQVDGAGRAVIGRLCQPVLVPAGAAAAGLAFVPALSQPLAAGGATQSPPLAAAAYIPSGVPPKSSAGPLWSPGAAHAQQEHGGVEFGGADGAVRPLGSSGVCYGSPARVAAAAGGDRSGSSCGNLTSTRSSSPPSDGGFCGPRERFGGSRREAPPSRLHPGALPWAGSRRVTDTGGSADAARSVRGGGARSGPHCGSFAAAGGDGGRGGSFGFFGNGSVGGNGSRSGNGSFGGNDSCGGNGSGSFGGNGSFNGKGSFGDKGSFGGNGSFGGGGSFGGKGSFGSKGSFGGDVSFGGGDIFDGNGFFGGNGSSGGGDIFGGNFTDFAASLPMQWASPRRMSAGSAFDADAALGVDTAGWAPPPPSDATWDEASADLDPWSRATTPSAAALAEPPALPRPRFRGYWDELSRFAGEKCLEQMARAEARKKEDGAQGGGAANGSGKRLVLPATDVPPAVATGPTAEAPSLADAACAAGLQTLEALASAAAAGRKCVEVDTPPRAHVCRPPFCDAGEALERAWALAAAAAQELQALWEGVGRKAGALEPPSPTREKPLSLDKKAFSAAEGNGGGGGRELPAREFSPPGLAPAVPRLQSSCAAACPAPAQPSRGGSRDSSPTACTTLSPPALEAIARALDGASLASCMLRAAQATALFEHATNALVMMAADETADVADFHRGPGRLIEAAAARAAGAARTVHEAGGADGAKAGRGSGGKDGGEGNASAKGAGAKGAGGKGGTGGGGGGNGVSASFAKGVSDSLANDFREILAICAQRQRETAKPPTASAPPRQRETAKPPAASASAATPSAATASAATASFAVADAAARDPMPRLQPPPERPPQSPPRRRWRRRWPQSASSASQRTRGASAASGGSQRVSPRPPTKAAPAPAAPTAETL